jgi:hypothetical protein
MISIPALKFLRVEEGGMGGGRHPVVISRLRTGKLLIFFYSATASAELVPEVGSTWQLLHPLLQHVHLVEEICQQTWLFVVEVIYGKRMRSSQVWDES